MGILKNFVESYKRKKEKYKEAEEDYKVGHLLQQRQKNANERELERYYEEERQKQIERELKSFRKRRMDEMYKTNIFHEHYHPGKNIFKSGKKVKGCNFIK